MTNPAPGFVKHPNYLVAIEPLESPLQVTVGTTVIATSHRAVCVTETKHRPVWYMPLDDIQANSITPTDTQTYCPFKGKASYWSVVLPETTIEDAIWAYLEPYDECVALTGYASFYTNKVDLLINGQVMNKDGPGFV